MHWGGVTAFGGLAAVTALVATGDEVRRYPIPATSAREKLATTPLPDPLTGMGGGQVKLIREDGALVWQLGDSDHRSEGRVSLNGDGAATDVTISFDLADNAVGGSRIAAARLTKSLAESIFIEHVDAVLGGRPFDQQRMMMTTAQELQSNPEMLKEFGETVRQDMTDVATMFEEVNANNVRPPQSTEKATRPDPNSFKPTTDLTSKGP